MSHVAEVISYVEIDVPHCTLTYSVAPCTASLTASPPTGIRKCFNSLGTCQDAANFTDSPVTFRFSEDVRFDNVAAIDAYPLIKTIDFQPAIVSLGGDIGQRAVLKVTFKDARHSDAGPNFDKYPADRDYSDPYNRGTFWGKFRARNPFLRGRAIRYIRGTVGQTLSQMETRHLVIDSIDGPGPTGDFSIIAKDVLKLADGDRSVAPLLSNGFLNADITAVATTATLAPSGIGNAEYPASGYLAIGGKEVVTFTRSADTLTIVRAQLNTVGVEHKAQDRVQLILRYAAQDPADIISDLLQTYAGVPSAYVPLTDWQSETAGFLGTVYTLNICEPTSVADLIGELITQMGAAIWWDDLDQQLHLQVLRAVSTTAQRYNEDNVLADTLEVREQPEKRISQVIVYFGQINPLLKIDETSNYRSTESQSATNSGNTFLVDEGNEAIKTIFARGIAQGGRTIATRIAQKHLSRYVVAPRRFNFEILRLSTTIPHLGIGIRIGGGLPSVESWPFQDDTGARIDVPAQITRHNPMADRSVVEAEEMLFTQFSSEAIDTTTKTIILDANENNINLRTRHDELFGTPSLGDTIKCFITTGVIIGSTSETTPAFDVGTWPAGSPAIDLILIITGRIQGKGGQGTAVNGATHNGGTALYTRQTVSIAANQIWGGGGGGASYFLSISETAGGGGGAGQLPGAGGADSFQNNVGQPGTTEAGGAGGADTSGGHAGAGGGPGLAGSGPTAGPGNQGAAGKGVDGISYVTFGTWSGTAFSPGGGSEDVRGGTIN